MKDRLTITNPDSTHYYEWNNRMQLALWTNTAGDTATYAYDAFGKIHTYDTDASDSVHYGQTMLGRTWEYDDQNNPTKHLTRDVFGGLIASMEHDVGWDDEAFYHESANIYANSDKNGNVTQRRQFLATGKYFENELSDFWVQSSVIAQPSLSELYIRNEKYPASSLPIPVAELSVYESETSSGLMVLDPEMARNWVVGRSGGDAGCVSGRYAEENSRPMQTDFSNVNIDPNDIGQGTTDPNPYPGLVLESESNSYTDKQNAKRYNCCLRRISSCEKRAKALERPHNRLICFCYVFESDDKNCSCTTKVSCTSK